MKIDQKTVRKIAHLARLDFDEEAENEMIESMSKILDWVGQLQEVDTEGVDPLTSMTHEVKSWREDKPNKAISQERGLSQAPKHDGGYFRVPKVIE